MLRALVRFQRLGILYALISGFLAPAAALSAAEKNAPPPPKPANPTARSETQLDTVLAKDPGYVEFVHVEVGSAVLKDQLLVSLDTDKFRHTYETARIRSESKAQVATAAAEVRLKQSQHDTVKENVRFRRANQDQLDRSGAELDIARARLELAVEADRLAQLEFERARDQLEARFIRSPVDGVLVEVLRKRGDIVAPGSVVVRVADPSRVGASFKLSPEAAAEFETGSTIAVRKVGSDVIEEARIQSIFAIPGDASGTQQMNLLFADPATAQSAEYELVPDAPTERNPSPQ